jgi:quercetin dioxygenase-like cupin family protein
LVSQAHEPGSREHLTVQSGVLEVSAGQHTQRVKAGETARYAVDQAHAIRNTGRSVATAVLAVVHTG